ncbi:MAG: hypothetical protein KGI42_11680 [Xanthomonadaceae bacterium]|nr:hypothetical protein [Xanthomonadaceae bacterium]
MAAEKKSGEAKVVRAAFGAVNRQRLIEAFFAGRGADKKGADVAWRHVYELLLWIDQTTGLAHCYESDKCQPGKNWYARSLAFHSWLAEAFEVAPDKLSERLDWLFMRAAKDLAAEVLHKAERVAAAAEKQRRPYDDRGFPRPGEDPELVGIIREVLGGDLAAEPSDGQWRELVQRIRQYLTLENKRKNLLGEGFEDVLAAVVIRSCEGADLDVRTRGTLQDLPGFSNTRKGEKVNKVDLAVIRPGRRILITAKWSVRADREKQFVVDFTDYLAAESLSKPFDYVFVTNEFDPARLKRACERLASNSHMFRHVVHISTDALRATYGEHPEATMRQVLEYIDSGRLISLQQWLDDLKS